ncbi:MAG: tetratricopeptide repeat protein [Candidatus Eisenbacteria bacterium]
MRTQATTPGSITAKTQRSPGRPIQPHQHADEIRPSKYAKWRAGTLALVYVLMVVHIVHWKLAGKTLAPLEVHEVMYTLELGVVTAGFLLMAATFVASGIFGRFFCSWGCHLLALQDLCAWLLGKVGIRPKPIRSRLLLLVPIGAMFYMIVWPQIARGIVRTWPQTTNFLGARPDFQIRVIDDTEGWASFVTTDFWRNLPGPAIGLLTLLVCGFLIVYVLGSRSFCTYACPYGVIFGFLDRFAPGRIVLKGDCSGCGHCTAVCDSHIKVHEEVARFGKVVSPGCLKDLDCVSACPTEGLSFGWTKPALFKSWSQGRSRIRYGFSMSEEILMVLVFIASVLIFRGLYSLVPFLMTLGIGVTLALIVVYAVRLFRDANLRLGDRQLKLSGRLTRWGRGFATAAFLLFVFVFHSAFIRYHEVGSTKAFDEITAAVSEGKRPSEEIVSNAFQHLHARQRWGLVDAADIDWRLASLSMFTGSLADAEAHLRTMVDRHPEDMEARLQLATALLGLGRTSEARAELATVVSAPLRSESDGPRVTHYRSRAHSMLGSLHATAGDHAAAIAEYEASLDQDAGQPQVHLALAELFGEDQRFGESIQHLESALTLDPTLAPAHYNLGVFLAMEGREEEAIRHLDDATRLDSTDPVAPNTLGRLYARRGNLSAAEDAFRRALAARPDFEEAQRNLEEVLAMEGRSGR